MTTQTQEKEKQSQKIEYRSAGLPAGWWAKQGVWAGLVSGIIFAAFEMMIAAGLAGNFWGPLRMIGGIVLGQQALTPEYSLAVAAGTGLVVHVVLSMIFGTIFAGAIGKNAALKSSSGALILGATVFGFLLWLVNFYVIAPIFGWQWFPNQANALFQGFIAHTFFFGTVLGLMLDGVRRKRAVKLPVLNTGINVPVFTYKHIDKF